MFQVLYAEKKKEDTANGLRLENVGESHPEILCGLFATSL